MVIIAIVYQGSMLHIFKYMTLINSAIVTFNVRIAEFNCCEALVRIGYELKKIIGMNSRKLGIVGICERNG
jgi:hypothetical protein